MTRKTNNTQAKKSVRENEQTFYTDDLAIEIWKLRNVYQLTQRDVVDKLGVSLSSVARWGREVEIRSKLLDRARKDALGDAEAPLGGLVNAGIISKKVAVMRWLQTSAGCLKPGETVDQLRRRFKKETGLEVYPTYFSTVRGDYRRQTGKNPNETVNETLDAPKREVDAPKREVDAPKKEVDARDAEKLQAVNRHLRDEVAYYKWLVEGERRGWMERYLKER